MSDAAQDAMVYIGESQLSNIDTVRKLPTPYAMIFRDVYRMEDTYRKEMTRVISFTGIDHSLDSLEDGILIPYGFFASIRLALSYIEHVFCSIPQRPTGDLPNAP